MTDRAKIANVKSIMQQQHSKSERRSKKSNSRSMVPVSRPTQGGSTQLRAANESVSLADRLTAELTNMEDHKLFSDRQLDLLGIVHPRSQQRGLVDAMRQLRTKLYSLQPDGNFSVLVSSVVPEGGGSFVAMNLAATIAFDKSKTSLLVDANVHDPVLHKLLKLIGREEAHGLVDYLENPSLGVEHIVSPSGIPRMRVIPMGNHPDRSSEHFSSARYKRLMVDIKDRYSNRFVVVDGPAMDTSTDARILSEICDYTVLVVPYGGVTPGALDAVVDEIDERKLAGVVINDQPN
ncbi:MAG: CpsD/CapB family tyrosine-protein kinase [Gammaproteobacteria bacterium]|nr:CpsD/CapB family tyrosine-protein kinase [Gammaproteobacteria bacterium]